jgi:hypothetical protein
MGMGVVARMLGRVVSRAEDLLHWNSRLSHDSRYLRSFGVEKGPR